jgi:hypothetical protein
MAWKARMALFAAALWWGSLGAIGFVAVPVLFAQLPSKALAGQTAAHLFTAQTWLSIACGLVLLMASRSDSEESGMGWAQGALGFVMAGVLCALLGEFAVAPRILARENLALWHGAGTALYGAQWICALVVLAKIAR